MKDLEKKQQQGGEAEKEKKANKAYNFEKCDFPIPYENKGLRRGWFCFNDTSVFPIQLGVLQR